MWGVLTLCNIKSALILAPTLILNVELLYIIYRAYFILHNFKQLGVPHATNRLLLQSFKLLTHVPTQQM